jgi:hypothetical protein
VRAGCRVKDKGAEGSFVSGGEEKGDVRSLAKLWLRGRGGSWRQGAVRLLSCYHSPLGKLSTTALAQTARSLRKPPRSPPCRRSTRLYFSSPSRGYDALPLTVLARYCPYNATATRTLYARDLRRSVHVLLTLAPIIPRGEPRHAGVCYEPQS